MIGLAEALAGVMLLSLIAYALLAGADFGGGVWDLFASGPRAGRQRDTIAHAIGPIWEANHVWLILVVVLMFSAFPPMFARLMTVLHIPIALMLVGIVLRGSSFVFRTYDVQETHVQRRWGAVFAVSSLVTPVLLGVVVGAISSPELATPPDASFRDVFVRPWLRPFPFAVGLFALAQFAFLAAVYLTLDADEEELREDFRRRALASAVAVGVLAFSVIALSEAVAPEITRRLLSSRWSWPLQAAAAACALGAIATLWARWYRTARALAAAQVALVLLGWGLAMNPYLIAGVLTIEQAAAPPEVLRLLAIGLAAGAVVLVPALVYLFRTFKGGVIFGAMHGREER